MIAFRWRKYSRDLSVPPPVFLSGFGGVLFWPTAGSQDFSVSSVKPNGWRTAGARWIELRSFFLGVYRAQTAGSMNTELAACGPRAREPPHGQKERMIFPFTCHFPAHTHLHQDNLERPSGDRGRRNSFIQSSIGAHQVNILLRVILQIPVFALKPIPVESFSPDWGKAVRHTPPFWCDKAKSSPMIWHSANALSPGTSNSPNEGSPLPWCPPSCERSSCPLTQKKQIKILKSQQDGQNRPLVVP